MNILAALNGARWLLAAVACVVLVLAVRAGLEHQRGIGEARTAAKYEARIALMQQEAAALLKAETDKVNAANARLQQFKDERELTDAKHNATVATLAGRLRVLAGASGQLRDPHASACRERGPGPEPDAAAAASPGADDAAETDGLLSAQLSGLLRRLTHEADEINNAFASCKADADAVRSP